MIMRNPEDPLPNAAPAGAHIAAVAVVSPPFKVEQAQADAFLTKHYADRLSPRSLSLMHKILEHPSIKERYFALENPECLVDEDPDSRIARFTHWSVELSARAVSNALDQAGLTTGDVSGLVVNTCTGYILSGDFDLPHRETGALSHHTRLRSDRQRLRRGNPQSPGSRAAVERGR